MANISFNEDQQYARQSRVAMQPALVRLVLSTKVVDTPRKAEYVLIGIGIAALLLALVLWPWGRPAPEITEEVARPAGIVR